MRATIRSVAIIVLLLMIAASTRELIGARAFSSAIALEATFRRQQEFDEKSQRSLNSADTFASNALRTAREQTILLSGARTAAAWQSDRSDGDLLVSRLLRQQGTRETDPKKRVSLFCAALSAMGQAIAIHPFRSTYLVNWANLRQMLAGVSCDFALTSGDFEKAVALALTRDPTNAEVAYAGGLVVLWAGKRDAALSLFNRVIKAGADTAPSRQTLFFSLIQSERDLKALVPGTFPQIAQWSDRFRVWDSQAFTRYRGAFTQLQTQAIEISESNFQSGAIPERVHLAHLLSLVDLVASDSVRRVMDHSLAQLFARTGRRPIAEFLENRSTLAELDVISSYMAADTRPQHSSMVDWASQREVPFDEFYASAGFYLPPGQAVKLLQLESRSNEGTVAHDELSLYLSDDNITWRETSSPLEIRYNHIGSKNIISVSGNFESARYWKLHFSSAVHRRRLLNTSDRLIRAFGTSIRNIPAEETKVLALDASEGATRSGGKR